MTDWKNSSPIALFIHSLLDDALLERQLVCHKVLPAKPANFKPSVIPWSAPVANILKEREISLYSHQALATDHIRAGHSVVVSTPTASGKSMIYNLPVLEKYLHDPDATALYLFPLKALAQDQLANFKGLTENWPASAKPSVALYDGDTPDEERRAIRINPPAVLITNPEMLHLALLPYHTQWTSFLAGLSYVVVDEAHTYRGIFGAHMGQVFRRLRRIANRYGAEPQFIFSTATLGNPVELAAALMDAPSGSEPVNINESGAPAGLRHFIIASPDLSPATFAIDLLKRALAQDLRTIVYCRSRRMTELISIWASQEDNSLKERISSYRSGYLPAERREIEKRMASGELKAVISTSALELGIDIGGLDLCILVGYPGSVMQTLQRGGRVGRAHQDSAVALICGEDALDQFFAKNPQEFFSRPPEKAVINPDNEIIQEIHLECAASEAPLSIAEPLLQKPSVARALENLQKKGLVLQAANGAEWLATSKYPQRKVDLRVCGNAYILQDISGKIIGNVDGFRAWKEAHPGAVYLHRGRNYVIDSLDSAQMRITARQEKVKWYTKTRGNKTTDILFEKKRKSFGNCAAFLGRLRVSEFITGYEKRSVQGQELLGISPLNAPPFIFETDGLWIVVPDKIRQNLENRFIHFMGAIHAFEHAAIGLLPLEVMADRNDFGGISIPLHHQLGLPAVFIYDAVPGGAGLCKSAFENIERLMASVRDHILHCPCEDGCPSCIHSPKCGSGNRPLSKSGSVELLKELLAKGKEGEKIRENLIIAPAPERLLAETASLTAKQQKPSHALVELDNNDIDRLFSGLPLFKDKVYKDEPVLIKDPAIKKLSENEKARACVIPDNYVVFDVETRKSAREVGGWKNASLMEVSIVCLYESTSDQFYSYEQEELEEFFKKLRSAGLIIGYNSFKFDYEVLSPFASIFMKGQPLRALPGLDLMQRVLRSSGTRVSLDNLARNTLESGKNANGQLALRWWKEGNLASIRKYCQKDVELTRDIYLSGLKKGFLYYQNKAGAKVRISVDFSTN